MKTRIAVLLVAFALAPLGSQAATPINVVATTQDLADLAKAVGGNAVEVMSLSLGDKDPHNIDPRPSMVIKVRKADLLLMIGMDLDMWIRSITDMAQNMNIVYGGKGYVDCSVGVRPLQVPTEKFDGASGDIHVLGNPHYLLDPKMAWSVTKNILDGLVRVAPERLPLFQKNREEFLKRLDSKVEEWTKKLSRLKNRNVITYHDSWVYFTDRFKLTVAGTVESKPGIPASPAHLAKLLGTIEKQHVPVIILSTFHDPSPAEYLKKKTGIRLAVLPQSVGGSAKAKSYIEMFDEIVDALVIAGMGVGVEGGGA